MTPFCRHGGSVPGSPTVPFQSNQRGEAGSRRNDIEEAQLVAAKLGRGMLGEVYRVMLPLDQAVLPG